MDGGSYQRARYDVGEQLGRGGMGTIHRAHDRELGRAVAYKRLRVDREGNRAAMTVLFRREYELMLSLEHPSTVQAFDFGFDEHGPFYTMELLSGADLSRRVLRQQLAQLAALEGEYGAARDSLSGLLAQEADAGNRLTLGSLHHDLALVALFERAKEPFQEHARAAERLYRETGSASLLAKHERLLARARRAGLLAEAASALDDDDDDLGDTHVEGPSGTRPSSATG